MPEGDTVHLAATRLNAAFGGTTLTKTDFRVPQLATADLSGRSVTEVVARGKHLFFRLSGDVTLHTHFRMDGSWHLYRPGGIWKGPADHARLLLENGSWVAVGFSLPVVELLPTSAEPTVVGHLGPDVLGPDWDPAEAVARFAADPARTVGDALLDQSVMAGPGNVYRCEICFLLGVHPSLPVAALGDPRRAVELTKRVMEANRSTGRQVTTGDLRPGKARYVYGRGGKPCRRCGALILSAEVATTGGARITYWCPKCQGEVASESKEGRVGFRDTRRGVPQESPLRKGKHW